MRQMQYESYTNEEAALDLFADAVAVLDNYNQREFIRMWARYFVKRYPLNRQVEIVKILPIVFRKEIETVWLSQA